MKKIQEIIFHPGSKEEILPDFMPDFPYIASWVESDRYMGCFAPWHWHKAVELFY
ncbi:MAG TPA: AraC family transcriptional regulator, partial [Anaerotruncus colihominis]|nr:AraC family transcriptional regulator [Anaerotruncus colihominis]